VNFNRMGPVTMERCDDARVVSLRGEHDVSTAGCIRELLADARAAGGLVFVDLTAATFIDTTIAVVLLEAFHADTPPRLRFVVPADSIPRRAFQRMGFGTGLPIYDQLQDALHEGR
jgi:anti-sigma B factor antagonist